MPGLSKTALHRFESCSMRQFKKGEYHITRTCHCSVLILMLSGVLYFKEDGEEIAVRSGEYYIQRQGLEQEGHKPCEEPEYFYIHFDGTFVKEGGLPLRGTFCVADVLPMIRKMERTYFSPGQNDFTVTGLLYEILGQLQTDIGYSKSTAEQILRMENYMLAHFRESYFSVREMAAEFHISETYLIKLFRKRFSKTPYQYIKELRIAYAKQLMLSTERALADIAAECGYADYSVFYKSFLCEVGRSPRLWQKEMAAF